MRRIVIDTREQTPWPFEGIETIRGTLKLGDYSIEGFEDRVAIERKSKEDAWGTTAGKRGVRRQRMEDRMRDLGKLDRAAVVIECSVSEFLVKPPHVRILTGPGVIHTWISWGVRYGVPVVWMDTRVMAEAYAKWWFRCYLKHVAKEGA